MIYRDRAAVAEPPKLEAIRKKGYLHAKKFFDRPLARRRQERYFNPYWDQAYWIPVPALARLFHGKCAFCETKIPDLHAPAVRGVLDHMRPKWGTRGLGGEYDNDHYWWLAFVWSNLYLTCIECNKQRGPRFPVKGSRVPGPDVSVDREEPLLLDPCRDDPNKHLRFLASGQVEPLSRRGEISVELWGLNRADLVQRRAAMSKDVLRPLLRPLRRSMKTIPADAAKALNALMSPEAEFSAFATQIIHRHLGDHPSLRRSTTAAQEGRAAVKHKGPITPRFLHEVRIRNFRGIRDLHLIAPSSEQRDMDWLMLIGENAAGKSSILQAITLALLSEQERDQLNLDISRVVKRGEQSGWVELRFRDGGEPRRLSFSRRKVGFQCTDPSSAAPTMAYGATRLPAPYGASPRSVTSKNLFDPFTPLTDAVAWLRELNAVQFDFAARALKSMLALDQKSVRFRKAQGNVMVRLFGDEVSLAQLSDGYQSVIALAADLMETIHHTFRGGFETAEGIVLLDELGAHLHPRWKMRIAKALRQAFPRLQFIVTTHDPLCLRGLRDGEVAVIERTSRGRVYARTDLPNIEGMRVDQILQSEFFGLRSAMDPDVEKDFEKMYRLKSRHTLSRREKKDLAKLEANLAKFQVLGSTRSERLMLSEINRFLAEEEDQPVPAKRDALWKQAQKRISARLKDELGIVL